MKALLKLALSVLGGWPLSALKWAISHWRYAVMIALVLALLFTRYCQYIPAKQDRDHYKEQAERRRDLINQQNDKIKAIAKTGKKRAKSSKNRANRVLDAQLPAECGEDLNKCTDFFLQ